MRRIQNDQISEPVGNAIHGEEQDECHDQKNANVRVPTSTPGKEYSGNRIEVVRRTVEITSGVVFDGEASIAVGAAQPMDPNLALQLLANNGCTKTIQDMDAYVTPLTFTLPGTTGFVRAVVNTLVDAGVTQNAPA